MVEFDFFSAAAGFAYFLEPNHGIFSCKRSFSIFFLLINQLVPHAGAGSLFLGSVVLKIGLILDLTRMFDQFLKHGVFTFVGFQQLPLGYFLFICDSHFLINFSQQVEFLSHFFEFFFFPFHFAPKLFDNNF